MSQALRIVRTLSEDCSTALCDDLAIVRYGHNQLDELAQRLDEIDRQTILRPVDRIENIDLGPEGYVGVNRYRLSQWAFAQLCSLCSPHLLGVITDLGGLNRVTAKDRQGCDPTFAWRFVRDAVRLRFEKNFAKLVMICHSGDRRIDGFVSGGYRWYSNSQYLRSARAAIGRYRPGAVFQEASLRERWLACRFVDSTPFARTTDEKLYGGLSIISNEARAGGMRARRQLYRKLTKSASLVDDGKSSNRHLGDDIQGKVDATFQRLLQLDYDREAILGHFEKLRKTPLRVETHDAWVMRRRLTQLAVQVTPALGGLKKSIVETLHTLVYRDINGRVVDSLNAAAPGDRTALDFYEILCEQAKDLPPNYRDSYELAAYRLLANGLRS
jgi:hypothetical protein